MEPTNNEPTNSVSENVTVQEITPLAPLMTEEVVQPVTIPPQGNFFDRNVIAIVFVSNILIPERLMSYLDNKKIGNSFELSILHWVLSAILILTIILGVSNFRSKRKEIFKGLFYIVFPSIIVFLVGFAVCLSK